MRPCHRGARWFGSKGKRGRGTQPFSGTALALGDAMWLEAILTKADLEKVLQQFSPLTIRLGDNGRLLLAEPIEVLMLPDEGIGVVCDVTVHWPILGFDVPLALKGLTLRVLPLVDTAAPGSPLTFRLQIDHTGVAVLPAIFDHSVTAMINAELEKKHVELSWTFLETLSHEFGLPESMASVASISLVATAGRVKATDKALGLAVQFTTAVRKRSSSADSVDGPPQTAPIVATPARGGSGEGQGAASAGATNGSTALRSSVRPAPQTLDGLSFAMGGAFTALALTAVGGIVTLARKL